MTAINLYCDESGHLENDQVAVMVLGVVTCPRADVSRVARDLRAIKQQHGMGHGEPSRFEAKWSKLSPAGMDFYRQYLDYFFDSPALSFRALVVRDKRKLRHVDFEQTHDDWYYKMFYQALEPLLTVENSYEIYLDIKDTLSQKKVVQLRKVLSYRLRNFNQEVITRIQHVRSDEVEQIQLADLLIGAISYQNRALKGNAGKEAIVAHIKKRTGLTLYHSTGRFRPKFNLFFWDPQEVPHV
jgi:Protein of unknown function (DUF3800)